MVTAAQLEKMSRDELESLRDMVVLALSNADSLELLRVDLEQHMGRKIRLSAAVKYATEVKDMILRQLSLGMADNDNRPPNTLQ